MAHQREGAQRFITKSSVKEDAGSTCPNSATDHWPTDDEEFECKAQATSVHIKQTVRYTLVTTAVLWLSMFFWSAAKFWIDPLTLTTREAMGSPVGVAAETLQVAWPSLLFRPKTMACAGGQIFASDGFRVFELFADGSPAREVSCGLSSPLAGLTAACDSSPAGCRPFVLLEGSASGRSAAEVIDCSLASSFGAAAAAWPLLQDEELAEQIAFLPAAAETEARPQNVTGLRLLSARNGEMVQFAWSENQGGWAPEWMLGQVSFLGEGSSPRPGLEASSLGPRAVGANSSGRVLLFRADVAQRPAVEARDPSSMELKGRWLLPSGLAPLAGGCAWDEASALVLPAASASTDGAAGPRLVRVTLP